MSSLHKDLQQLGLPPTATMDEVKARWRQLAFAHHPDRGGDAATFDHLCKTTVEVLRQLTTPKPCAACQALGVKVVQRGPFQTTVLCDQCRGAKSITA